MKKLSLSGLADFMTKSASGQRKLLRNYKYPDTDDASAKILYYKEARDRILAYHSAGNDMELLTDAIKDLEKLAALSMGQRKTRLGYNVRALRDYARHFSKKSFEILKEASLGLNFDDVIVTVYPDLHVEEKGVEKFIKLGFSKDEPEQKFISIISQGLFEAARQEGHELSSSSILFLDVPRGKIHKGARMGARMTGNIEAACQNISAIWDKL